MFRTEFINTGNWQKSDPKSLSFAVTNWYGYWMENGQQRTVLATEDRLHGWGNYSIHLWRNFGLTDITPGLISSKWYLQNKTREWEHNLGFETWAEMNLLFDLCYVTHFHWENFSQQQEVQLAHDCGCLSLQIHVPFDQSDSSVISWINCEITTIITMVT